MSGYSGERDKYRGRKGTAALGGWYKCLYDQKFGVVNRYDLSKEFPAITLRKTAIKTCTEEMLWIWQRKSNNIHDLNSTVWDEWADENGSIGKAYGYQLAQKHQYREGMMDQVDRVIYDLKIIRSAAGF